MQDCIQLGYKLTTLPKPNSDHDDDDDPYITHLKTVTTTIDWNNPDHKGQKDFTIRIDAIQVAGTGGAPIVGIRHSTRVSKMSPAVLTDGIMRLTYTNLVDKYTYLVEPLEFVPIPNDNSSVAWAHVTYTADKLDPLGILNEREFCTLDFATPNGQLLVSRSCLHPKRPVDDARVSSFNVSRTYRYRSPLLYYNRVIPVSEEECDLVQFQFSDIGGFVPPREQNKAVVQFGLDNIPKLVATIRQAIRQGCRLGPKSPLYLHDPLRAGWRQDPQDMIPGLRLGSNRPRFLHVFNWSSWWKVVGVLVAVGAAVTVAYFHS